MDMMKNVLNKNDNSNKEKKKIKIKERGKLHNLYFSF